jgi:nicotinate-nucleotide--dimethylbenzimidazole phosphoribosyltransferase
MTLPSIPPLDPAAVAAIQRELDNKTKPLGSLGRLETLTARYAAIRGRNDLRAPKKAMVIMAADHGVAAAGVSAFPQSVTEQMLRNFAAGGAAINAFAKNAGATLTVVNLGTLGETPPGVIDARVRQSSNNLLETEALTEAEVWAALDVGVKLAAKLAAEGVTLVGVGEMGIGNTTVAACLCAAFCRTQGTPWVGRGTGIDDSALARKRAVVEAALARHQPNPSTPIRVLCQLGGLEVIGLAGLMLGAASQRMAVIVDGFITSAAALAAVALNETVKHYLFASHLSTEPGHRLALDQLGLSPVLDLQCRLGEGTGAALAMPLFDAGVTMLLEMATFESANVDRRTEATQTTT